MLFCVEIYETLAATVEAGVSVTAFLVTIITGLAVPFLGFGKVLSNAKTMFVHEA